MHDLTTLPSAGFLTTEMAVEFEAAADHAEAALAPPTRYTDNPAAFRPCGAARGPAGPHPWTANAGLKPATIAGRVAAIRYIHPVTGLK